MPNRPRKPEVPPYAVAIAKAYDELIDRVRREVPPGDEWMRAIDLAYDAREAAISAVIAGSIGGGKEWDAFAGRWRESGTKPPAIGRKTTAA